MRDFDITCADLKKRLSAGTVLVDVREPAEFQIANLGGKLIPLSELPDRLNELSKDSEIVVHCHHGGRSAMAVEFLRAQGFSKVWNLAGGIDAWSHEIDAAIPRY